MKDRIITALDVDNIVEAKALVDKLAEAVFFKVGLQAFLGFGNELITHLKSKNKKLFLDLKFKDIPNTVYGAVKSSLKYTPEFLTIHLSGGAAMIKQAVAAAADVPGLSILGVTVLTSLSAADLKDIGVALAPEDAVLKLCELGLNNGLNSFVCSPLEIAPIKKRFGRDVVLVTPGIRPEWAAKGDQQRVFTPKMAVEAGSDYLVIGRPITRSESPHDAFIKILDEISCPVRTGRR
ncbi:MAG: orotidine-5'-phosphate decarboxylase [Candidatus Aminicenantes bacterium]|nr:orotidine-5'-phosphate decarboxylase [Candidatus Aminicenantes bacterium]